MFRLPVAATAVILFCVGPLVGQEASTTAGFIARLGNDTIVVERVIRTSRELRGVYVERSPRVTIWRYSAQLAPDGTIKRFEVSGQRAPAAGQLPASVMAFGKDSATVQLIVGGDTSAVRLATPVAAFPAFLYCTALYEQAIMQAVRRAADSFPIELIFAGSRRTRDNAIKRVSRDTVSFGYFGQPMFARIDAAGRVLGLTGRATTMKMEVERLPDVDAEALANDFLAREQAGGAVGNLSPRDTTRATLGTTRLWVDYGRPSRRGRDIFGNVVPWGEVWRTGANAATQFSTTSDLRFGEVLVPAGMYTLWTIPSPDRTTLIINRQTGQWGTEYRSSEDLARLEMTSGTLDTPVEQFTISIQTRGDGGVLTMAWDRTRWSIPFERN